MQLRVVMIILSVIALAESNPTVIRQILDSVQHQPSKEQFKIWHFLHKKTYDLNTQEGLQKYKNFKATLKYINKRNAEQSSFRLGLNQFSDLTFEEFRSQYLTKSLDKQMENERNFLINQKKKSFDELAEEADKETNKETNPPKYTDWDWSEVYDGVRNQQSCGSCWAFTTAGVVEGWMWEFTNLNFQELSEQELVDCDRDNYGCNGGWYTSAFKYIQNNGIMTAADYPYENKQYSCRRGSNSAYTKIPGYRWCSSQSNYSKCSFDQFREVVEWSPIAVAIEANEDWQSYRSGKWNGYCNSGINHAVILVQVTPGVYKIRNSWGSGWGESGYMRMQRNDSNNNTCYLQNDGYWVDYDLSKAKRRKSIFYN